MDINTQPNTSSSLRPEGDAKAGPNQSSSSWARWEAPSGRRKFVPGVVIGLAVLALFVGMDYKFKHKDENRAESQAETSQVAQGPAVETIVNETPTAAGPAPSAEARTDTAAPTSAAPATDSAPAAAAPAAIPAPAPAPRREATRTRSQPVQPSSPPVNEAPVNSEPVQSAPTPIAEPPAQAPATQPAPAPEPEPEPAPSN